MLLNPIVKYVSLFHLRAEGKNPMMIQGFPLRRKKKCKLNPKQVEEKKKIVSPQTERKYSQHINLTRTEIHNK